jgi:hypothetical protein
VKAALENFQPLFASPACHPMHEPVFFRDPARPHPTMFCLNGSGFPIPENGLR